MSLNGPHAKILEAMWWWIDHYKPLSDFMNAPARTGIPHKYKLVDGSIMPAGDVMANDCPALTIEPTGEGFPISGIKLRGFGPSENAEAQWGLTVYGYLATLSYDEINEFYSLTMDALRRGMGTLFAVDPGVDDAPIGGLLQGTDQILEGFALKGVHPGGLWLNPSDLDSSNNTPSISFFAIQFIFTIKLWAT